MKISKLFHWLYATLMFLPLLFFVPSMLYYSLNEHATNDTITEITYKYETNDVNNLSDIELEKIYHADILPFESISGDESEYTILILHYDSCDINYDSYYADEVVYQSYNSNQGNNIYLYGLIHNHGILDLSISFTNDNSYCTIIFEESNAYFNNCDFIILDGLNGYLNEYQYWLNDDLSRTLPTSSTYNVIDSINNNYSLTITEQLNLAWQNIWTLPLFSWTTNSFISVPFTYLTGLFGLESTNSLNYLFTYFVSISICWLVFDLLMYVPNLAHRWLDRSSLQ